MHAPGNEHWESAADPATQVTARVHFSSSEIGSDSQTRSSLRDDCVSPFPCVQSAFCEDGSSNAHCETRFSGLAIQSPHSSLPPPRTTQPSLAQCPRPGPADSSQSMAAHQQTHPETRQQALCKTMQHRWTVPTRQRALLQVSKPASRTCTEPLRVLPHGCLPRNETSYVGARETPSPSTPRSKGPEHSPPLTQHLRLRPGRQHTWDTPTT